MFSTIYLDAPLHWQFGFQDPATPVMEGTINFHHDLFFFLVAISIFSNIFIFINMYKKLIYLKFNKQIINIYFFNDYNNQNKSNNIVENKNIGGSLPLPNPNDKEKTKKKSSKKKYRKRDIFLTIATTIVFGVLIYIFFKGNGGDNPSDLGSSSSLLPDGSQKQVTINKNNEAVSIIGSATLVATVKHIYTMNENNLSIPEIINLTKTLKEVNDILERKYIIDSSVYTISDQMLNHLVADENTRLQEYRKLRNFMVTLKQNIDPKTYKEICAQAKILFNENLKIAFIEYINNLFDSINKSDFYSIESYHEELIHKLGNDLKERINRSNYRIIDLKTYKETLKQICIERMDENFFKKVNLYASRE